MTKFLLCFIFIGAVSAQDLFTTEFLDKVTVLRDVALTDSTAYEITESLTTEVGPRLGGS